MKSELQAKAANFWSRLNKAYSEQPAKKEFLIDRDTVAELLEFMQKISDGAVFEKDSVGRI